MIPFINDNQTQTLQEYLQIRNLQRRRENYVTNNPKNLPNPLTLEKQNQIDRLTLEILDYVKSIVGTGAIFVKFRIMLQKLYKIFHRELSQFHNIGVANKIKTDQRFIDQIKKSNCKLDEYLNRCEKDKIQADKKLERLKKQNQNIGAKIFIKKYSQKKEDFEDDFENEVVEEKIGIRKDLKISFKSDQASSKQQQNKSSIFLNENQTNKVGMPMNHNLKKIPTKYSFAQI